MLPGPRSSGLVDKSISNMGWHETNGLDVALSISWNPVGILGVNMHILKKNGVPLSMHVLAPSLTNAAKQKFIIIFKHVFSSLLAFSYFGEFHNIGML